MSLALGQTLSRVGKIGYCRMGTHLVSMGHGMGAKQMAQRLRSDLQVMTETDLIAWFVRKQPESDAIVTRLIPDYLRVRVSFAGH